MAAVDFFSAFQYKWAQTGNVFAWDDAQYKLGWATIGSTPPSVEQFNRAQQVLDEKSNWLYGQLKTVADAKSVTLSSASLTGLQQVLAAYGQSSVVDATAGVWMRVGAFGWGGATPSLGTLGYPADFNQIDVRTEFLAVAGNMVNGPAGAGTFSYTGIVKNTLRSGTTRITFIQELHSLPSETNANGSWIRYGTGGTTGARTWTAWEEVYTSRTIPAATLTQSGIIEIATGPETVTGTDATRAVSPNGLTSALAAYVPAASTTVAGKIEIATGAEAIAALDNSRAMTPVTTAQAQKIIVLANSTTAGAFSITIPDGCYSIQAELVGAGAGGGAGSSVAAGVGGGAGGWGVKYFSVTPGQVLTGVIGLRGTGGSGSGVAGGNGGATSFQGVTANGGVGGGGGTTGGGGTGGAVTGADFSISGGNGNGPSMTNAGGTISLGPPGGGSARQAVSVGGYSLGVGIVGAGAGNGGGGGAGGSGTTQAGANGAPGQIIIWGF